MNNLTRNEIHQLLKENECIVSFTKVNGELREMPCTLKEDLITQVPADHGTEKVKIKKENPNILSVWCTDKKAWRSFRLENVLSVKIKE